MLNESQVMSIANVTLIIFTCEGREHLLEETIKSFKSNFNYKINKTILSIDGPISKDIIKLIAPDVIIENPFRKGYVVCINNALKLLETEYFFWLEDDWAFLNKISVETMIHFLSKNRNSAQIVLSKENYEVFNKLERLDSNIYLSPLGFSANPCLCRSEYVKNAFEKLVLEPKNENSKVVGFENFISEYILNHGFYSTIHFINQKKYINHIGHLESTAREYHMINSLDINSSDIGKEYISGLGYNKPITVLNKFSMIIKLLKSMIYLIIGLWKSRQNYDFAFRVHIAYLRRFK